MKAEADRMQACVDRLGLSLTVVWVPNPEAEVHGKIDKTSKTLFIYDVKPKEAWETLYHEIMEFKLREVTYVYRQIINSLIEAVEKLAYERKENFLTFIPKLAGLINREGGDGHE